jgi:hypothetical protein
VTEDQKSIKAGRGLRGFVDAVTLLNTDSNLNNTGPAGKNSGFRVSGTEVQGRQ